MNRRSFIVTLEVTVLQRVEVIALDDGHAEELATETYDLVGCKVLSESVSNVEEVTSYREAA